METRNDHSEPKDLQKYRISQLRQSAYYIPDFITSEEETALLEKIDSVPKPRWTQLSHRRLQTWPSALTRSNTLLASPLPEWLTAPILPRFNQLSIFEGSPHKGPNHILINEYLPNQGIMPHEDGPAYHPIVATVSLGASIVLEIYEKDGQGSRTRTEGPQWRILQEPRSLLVTTDAIYHDFLHGISERALDDNLRRDAIANWDLLGEKSALDGGTLERQKRISLTYRDVLRVSKIGGSLSFLGNK